MAVLSRTQPPLATNGPVKLVFDGIGRYFGRIAISDMFAE